MVGIHPGVFGNWVFVTDGPETSAYSCTGDGRVAWDRRGVAFPPSPLLEDFQALCSSFELAVAEEAAEYYELLELPLMIFYAMLLNEAERLGGLVRTSASALESALIELCWSAFESWAWLSASRPPRPLLEDFQALCSCFLLFKAEGTVAGFELPEIVQATFYTMLLNEAVEMGVAHDFTTESMKSSLIAQLQWPANEVEVRGSLNGQEGGSGLNGPPPPF
ncbi:hypothetical protein Cgig2_013864 [Carnegiea gigantea]|uniref:Uncharacterized protein n=1 Tax=Carnegiea gigantea TaxID=171969 RepID=A0A9Q1QLM6_9CARY|nr:hypothetical protein Cgig2_013864 [Carnegiea gigantea]